MMKERKKKKKKPKRKEKKLSVQSFRGADQKAVVLTSVYRWFYWGLIHEFSGVKFPRPPRCVREA